MYLPKSNSIPVLSQAEASYHIDQFVDKVLRTKLQAYTYHPQALTPYRMTSLGARLQCLNQMIALFDGWMDYDYSENLELFIDACNDIRLEHIGHRYTCSDPDTNGGFLSEPETMNLLVDRIRVLSRQGTYRRKASDRRYQAKRQAEEVRTYVQHVMDRYSKTLVLRVNLYYREVARQRLRVEHVFDDMGRLARELRGNRIFQHLTGWIIRVEQGQDQGFHLHAAFFFNGSAVFRQFCIAERIGELWSDITQNRGYWNDSSRDYSGEEERIGTGMFYRSGSKGRQAVADLMTYLVKDRQQYLRIRPAGVRAYRKGCIR